VLDFLLDRLKGIYLEQGVGSEVFEAVAEVRPTRPADFDRRVHAVIEFRALPEAEALVAANKRIRNLLRKAQDVVPERVDEARLTVAAEVVCTVRCRTRSGRSGRCSRPAITPRRCAGSPGCGGRWTASSTT